MNMEQWWNDIFAGETEVLGENLPSAILSTTNPTWIDPGANPGLQGERPATNRLSHGTASVSVFICQKYARTGGPNFALRLGASDGLNVPLPVIVLHSSYFS
jgi:hypothetical protein